MTCMPMLDRMLEADVSDLLGRGDSVVAAHVRECVRCRAIAEQLVADTRDLASAATTTIVAEPTSTKRAPRRAYVLAASGIAAMIVVLAFRHRGEASRAATSIVMRPVEVQPPAGVPIAPTSPVRLVSPKRSASNRVGRTAQPTGRPVDPLRVHAERTVVAAADRAVAVLPVRIAPTPQQSLGDTVSVDPSPGKRASVMRTDRPGVTVVWLYQ